MKKLALYITAALIIIFFIIQRDASQTQSDTQFHYLEEPLVNTTTELVHVLKQASFPDNKTVILAPLNSAWANEGGLFDLFLEGFREGDNTSHLLNHTIFIAMDLGAFNRCREVHPHCYELKTPGVDFSGEQLFMQNQYVIMNKRRLSFQGLVLQLGFNFIFSDMDILWFRPPFEHFSPHADMELACDKFKGNEWTMDNWPNMGFVHVRSNNRTIRLFQYWHEQNLAYPNIHEQNVFNKFKTSREFRDIGLKLRFMDTEYFGGFCKKSKDFTKVCTMHANCCKGTSNKLGDLRLTLEDWKRYKSMTPEERKTQKIEFRAPQMCRKKRH